MITKPGLYRLSYEEYVAIDAARVSVLKEFRRSALHVRHAMLEPDEDTKSTMIGTALHTAILEPASFDLRYAVAPSVDKRTKAGKSEWDAFVLENKDAILLTKAEYDKVRAMADAARSNLFVAEALGRSKLIERTIVFERLGVLCKGRIDLISIGQDTWVLDIKSSRDAEANAFARACYNYAYHAQAASYLYGLSVVHPGPSRRFGWIVVENAPPYGVAVYEASGGMLRQGFDEWCSWLHRWKDSVVSGHWPGYFGQPSQIDLPKWAWVEEVSSDDIG